MHYQEGRPYLFSIKNGALHLQEGAEEGTHQARIVDLAVLYALGIHETQKRVTNMGEDWSKVPEFRPPYPFTLEQAQDMLTFYIEQGANAALSRIGELNATSQKDAGDQKILSEIYSNLGLFFTILSYAEAQTAPDPIVGIFDSYNPESGYVVISKGIKGDKLFGRTLIHECSITQASELEVKTNEQTGNPSETATEQGIPAEDRI